MIVLFLLLFVFINMEIGVMGFFSPSPSETSGISESNSLSNSKSNSESDSLSNSLSDSQSSSETISESNSDSNSLSNSPSESNSNSNSYSNSESMSKSESMSFSESTSESMSALPGVVCTSMISAISDEYILEFKADLLLPRIENCKGRSELNIKNSKLLPGKPGLRAKWMENRLCQCPVYRVCTNWTCIDNEIEVFLGEVITDSFVNMTANMTCEFLPPYNPSPILLPPMVIENLLPEDLPGAPQISCLTADNQTVIANIYGFDIDGVLMEESVPVTCNQIAYITDDDFYEFFLECSTDIPVSGCFEYVLPTNFSEDVDRSKCEHKKVSGHEGLSEVETIFTASGSAILFFLLLLICCLVSYYRSFGKKGQGYVELTQTE